MSLDLNQVLDLPANWKKIKMLSISGDDLNNCSFLLHSLISSKVRSCRNQADESPFLVLILLSHSYTHYSSVAARSFGLNLKALKDSGRLVVLDVISNLQEYLNEERFDFDKLCFDIQECLSTVKESERNQSEDSTSANPRLESGQKPRSESGQNPRSESGQNPRSESGQNPRSESGQNPRSESGQESSTLVIIDDVSTLLSLQVSVSSIHKLVSRIRSFSLNHRMMIVIQTHIDDECEDEEMNTLAGCIASASDVWIESSKLETGFSQSIDGYIRLHDYKNRIIGKEVRKYHFKTMERNTKIFLPGSLSLRN